MQEEEQELCKKLAVLPSRFSVLNLRDPYKFSLICTSVLEDRLDGYSIINAESEFRSLTLYPPKNTKELLLKLCCGRKNNQAAASDAALFLDISDQLERCFPFFE